MGSPAFLSFGFLFHPAARQLVSHGHIRVNGRKVDVPSFAVSPGDELEVRDRTSHALIEYAARLAHEVNVHCYVQWQFDRQWRNLKRYSNERGIGVFLVEQNARQTLAIAHEGYVLAQGRVVAAGSAAALADDPDMKAIAEEEAVALRKRLPELEQAVKKMLLPKDAADEKIAILEIRAGTGGDDDGGDVVRDAWCVSRFHEAEPSHAPCSTQPAPLNSRASPPP